MKQRHKVGTTLLLATISFVVLSAPSSAQQLLRTIDGRTFDQFLWIESLSDIDGDQVDDLLVVGRGAGGRHMVRSGVTDEILWGPIALPSGYGAPKERVLGDFNGDGFDDVAIGYPAFLHTGLSRDVHIVDGRTGADITVIDVNWSPSGGKTVGDPGDVNGDGLADVIVGGFDTRKDVHLGPNGDYAYSVFGPSTFSTLPRGIGDVTGDGKDDFAIGWLDANLLTVYSGADGSELYDVCSPNCSSPTSSSPFGAWLAPLGDVDGDRVPDFAASDPGFLHPVHGLVGAVRVLSGVDGATIHTIWGRPMSAPFDQAYLGQSLNGGHDVNGDGVGDFAVTSYGGYFHADLHAHSVVSGKTGAVVTRVRNFDPMADSPGWPTTLADLDQDGFAEWAFVDPDYDAAGDFSGRIWIYKGGPGDAETICLGATNSAGTMATLTSYGVLEAETRELDFVVQGAVPDAFGHVVYGDEATASPFGDGDLCIDPASLRFYGTCFITDSTGRASVHADWGRPQIAHGPGAWLPGSMWVLQAVYRDAGGPSGFTTTSALRVQFFGG